METINLPVESTVQKSWFRRISYFFLFILIIPVTSFYLGLPIYTLGSCSGGIGSGINCSSTVYEILVSWMQIFILFGILFLPFAAISLLLGIVGLIKRKKDIEEQRALPLWKEPHVYNIFFALLIWVKFINSLLS